MFRVILSALLFAIFSFMSATASFADIEAEAEFARLHLDVQPASGWKKEEISSSMFSTCVAYVNKVDSIVLMGCPLVDGNEFKQELKEAKENELGVVAGKGCLVGRYDGAMSTLYVPLKKGGGGAFFIIGADGDPLSDDKNIVTIVKNGVHMTAFDPKLAQRSEPMLRAFRDFAIPSKLPSLPPIILYHQEELLKQYSAKRNWKLEPAFGWVERAPACDPSCLGRDAKPVAYAEYILPKIMDMTIKLCASSQSAQEIARDFYTKEKELEKEYPQSGESWNEPIEKSGTCIIESSTAKRRSIICLTSSKGMYSEISIDATKDASFKPAWELLGTLRTDNPKLFPQSYE